MGTWERWSSNEGAGWHVSGLFFFCVNWSKRELDCSEFGVILPEEGVISEHFGQFVVERHVKVPQDLFSDGQHGSQVFVSWPPGVWRRTSCDIWFYFLCQWPCKTQTNTFFHMPSSLAAYISTVLNKWHKIQQRTPKCHRVSAVLWAEDLTVWEVIAPRQLFEELSLSFGAIKLWDESVRQNGGADEGKTVFAHIHWPVTNSNQFKHTQRKCWHLFDTESLEEQNCIWRKFNFLFWAGGLYITLDT